MTEFGLKPFSILLTFFFGNLNSRISYFLLFGELEKANKLHFFIKHVPMTLYMHSKWVVDLRGRKLFSAITFIRFLDVIVSDNERKTT